LILVLSFDTFVLQSHHRKYKNAANNLHNFHHLYVQLKARIN